ncbi:MULTISPECIES: hypothetical protein [Rhizobium]|uniref:hypothetical protein n=1 Tax=Rhizobium TaxID=379 RepID=UPI0015717C89|nr:MULTISPECIES: hypothetical protein [Rhizobium]MDJ1632207.1 hypothetical protein [Rhizobium rhizogenes]NTG73536.1 hypothetical protein [Rhizobium rhizogenes]
MEQTIRLCAILLSMAVQAYVVNVRYRWARPQNGGPLPEMRDLLFFAALPVLTCVVGYMGLRLRIWSWSFVVFCAGGSWWIISQALADQGLFWTRVSYGNWMLNLSFVLALFGFTAAILVFIRSRRPNAISPSLWKFFTSGALIPIWFVVTLGVVR